MMLLFGIHKPGFVTEIHFPKPLVRMNIPVGVAADIGYEGFGLLRSWKFEIRSRFGKQFLFFCKNDIGIPGYLEGTAVYGREFSRFIRASRISPAIPEFRASARASVSRPLINSPSLGSGFNILLFVPM